MYFRWLESKNYHDNISNVIKLPRQSREFLKEPLTEFQVDKLLNVVDKTTFKGKRDYLIIILMLIRGLRCVEISRMNLSDIVTRDNQTCILIQRKAHYSKDDFINVNGNVDEINSYLNDIQNKDEDGPLFGNISNNKYGNRLAPMSIGRIITNYFQSSGIKTKKLTPHSLRHTAAVTLLRHGENIDNIQIFLGHSRSEITKIYTRYANNEIKMSEKQGKMLNKVFLRK
jgi:site-specific recombinase XerD